MSILLATIGWVLLGAITSTVLITFWDNIRNWLNNYAANIVEKQFGYESRQKMHRAISRIDRVMDKVRSKSTIFVKKNNLDTHYLKTEVVEEASVYNIDQEILNEIKANNGLVQEFEYRT